MGLACAPQRLNIVVRGQSNAVYFAADPASARLQAAVQRLTGIQAVTLIGGAGSTAWPATALVPRAGAPPGTTWLTYSAARGWGDDILQARFLGTLRALPASLRAAPTVTVWLQNESDKKNTALTQAAWESAIRFAVGEARAALGQAAARTPVDFVYVPFGYAPTVEQPAGAQLRLRTERLGFEHLAADPAFNAVVGAQIGDANMDRTERFFGGQHLDPADTAQLADRLALTIANQVWRLAAPGSPAARAHGQLDSTGPQAVAARCQGARDIRVTVSLPPGVGGLRALSPAAAAGAGWAVVGATIRRPLAVSLAPGGVVLHFTAAAPCGAAWRLYYGYDTGRIFPVVGGPGGVALQGAGRGAAIYDTNGLPLWETAAGLPVRR